MAKFFFPFIPHRSGTKSWLLSPRSWPACAPSRRTALTAGVLRVSRSARTFATIRSVLGPRHQSTGDPPSPTGTKASSSSRRRPFHPTSTTTTTAPSASGNYLNSRVYKPGEPCTQCQPGTRCMGNSSYWERDSLYGSLCKSETADGPQVTLPPGTIFYCNFHEPRMDCLIKEEPYGSFQVRRLIGGGGYLTATVGPNESAAVSLDRVLAVPDNDSTASCCLRFRFRKGPFRDGAGGSAALHVRLFVLGRNVVRSSALSRHYTDWTPYSITIHRATKVQLTLVLQVAAHSAPQYFDLTDVLLTRNPC
ncbi:CRISP/Allergen/PR-1-like isoform X3 [Haemaphysalis longicornis]